MTQQVMQWQLVGKGDVIVLQVPGDAPVSIAISDEEFVRAIDTLVQQAKVHPSSWLRRLRVENNEK